MTDGSTRQDQWNEELEIVRMETDYDCTVPLISEVNKADTQQSTTKQQNDETAAADQQAKGVSSRSLPTQEMSYVKQTFFTEGTK